MAKPIRRTAVVIAAGVDDMGDALSHKSHFIYNSNVCARFLAGNVASPIMLIFMDN